MRGLVAIVRKARNSLLDVFRGVMALHDSVISHRVSVIRLIHAARRLQSRVAKEGRGRHSKQLLFVCSGTRSPAQGQGH